MNAQLRRGSTGSQGEGGVTKSSRPVWNQAESRACQNTGQHHDS